MRKVMNKAECPIKHKRSAEFVRTEGANGEVTARLMVLLDLGAAIADGDAVPQITAANAREMAARSHEARRKRNLAPTVAH
jgi:hypothetical protein